MTAFAGRLALATGGTSAIAVRSSWRAGSGAIPLAADPPAVVVPARRAVAGGGRPPS